MVPQLSEPLAKSIRTGEGLLVYASNLALALAAALPSGLSWTHTALYLTILNSLHVVSRTGLKVAAVAAAANADPIAAITDAEELASVPPTGA